MPHTLEKPCRTHSLLHISRLPHSLTVATRTVWMAAFFGKYLDYRRPILAMSERQVRPPIFKVCFHSFLVIIRGNIDFRRMFKSKMSNMKLRHIFLAFADLLLTLPTPIRSQSACFSISQPVYRVVHEQAVSINTDVLFNTTFYPLPEAAITVTNAPTSYSGVTTLRWTSTHSIEDGIPSSQNPIRSTAPSPVPTQVQDTFVLIAMRPHVNQKRQSGSYFVNSEGTITNDCTTAPIYTARNGVLTASVSGVVYTYSTSAGVGFAPFVPSTVPGSITTAFTIGVNAVLQWQNPAFFNGQASFCALQNGTVYAVFAENAQPQGCLFISLSLFEVSSCQAISLATITGPVGPPGPIGSTGPQGIQGIQGAPGATVKHAIANCIQVHEI